MGTGVPVPPRRFNLSVNLPNLTEYAFTIMELDMLITSGRLPKQVEEHFDRLIETGVLRQASG